MDKDLKDRGLELGIPDMATKMERSLHRKLDLKSAWKRQGMGYRELKYYITQMQSGHGLQSTYTNRKLKMTPGRAWTQDNQVENDNSEHMIFSSDRW